MFDTWFPRHWSTLKKLIWLKASALASAAYHTVTGAIATFTTLRVAPLRSLAVTMKPKQDLHGYANPWPAGGGKNVLPTLTEAQTINGVTVTPNADGSITLTGTASAIAYFDLITGFDSTAYAGYIVTGLPDNMASNSSTICYRISTASSRASLQDIQRGAIGTYVSNTIVDNGTNLVFSLRVNNGYALPNGGLTLYPMMRASSTSANFEPYANVCPITGWTGANVYHSGADTSDATTYSITFPAAAGTVYGGTLDVTNGVLTVNKVALTFNGSEDWASVTANGHTRQRVTSALIGIKQITNGVQTPNLISDIYPTKTPNATYAGTVGITNQQNNEDLYIMDNRYDYVNSASDYKTWLSTNNMKVVYELADPVTYQLTPQEVQSLLGENNVWSDADSVTVTYRSN